MYEIPRLICVRVADMTAEPAAGSAKRACGVCGEEVWVAQSSQQMLASGDPYLLICMHCAPPAPAEQPVERNREWKLAEIARLEALAEESCTQMRVLREGPLSDLHYELASECLLDAARIARELGLHREAGAAEARAAQIRQLHESQIRDARDRPV